MSDITPELLLNAYANGVFPMADSADAPEVYWVDPTHRGVFPLSGFHISRSLARQLRKEDYSIALNQDFTQTLRHCADRPETWINPQIFELYQKLHALGFAHSLEVWRKGKMIGGVYGVALQAGFFGESMFSRATGGSKIALAYLMHRLRHGGFTLFDTQFITPHLASLGAVEIPRARYHQQLRAAMDRTANITAPKIPTAKVLLQDHKKHSRKTI